MFRFCSIYFLMKLQPLLSNKSIYILQYGVLKTILFLGAFLPFFAKKSQKNPKKGHFFNLFAPPFSYILQYILYGYSVAVTYILQYILVPKCQYVESSIPIEKILLYGTLALFLPCTTLQLLIFFKPFF